jgi:hypothetical protein
VSAPAVRMLAGHGLRVGLPPRWEGRIYRRPAENAAGTGAVGWPGEATHPVLHLANFALPAARGDYGTGAVELMGPADVFLALLQFGPDCLGTALYAPIGLPRLTARQFNPNGLQRRIAGQAGFQHFCTVGGRPLCVYAVLGSQRNAAALAGEADAVLARVELS